MKHTPQEDILKRKPHYLMIKLHSEDTRQHNSVTTLHHDKCAKHNLTTSTHHDKTTPHHEKTHHVRTTLQDIMNKPHNIMK